MGTTNKLVCNLKLIVFLWMLFVIFASRFLQVALQVIGVVTIVSVNNPYLLIPSLSLGVVFYFIRRYYLKTARSVKRLEGIGIKTFKFKLKFL